MEITLTDEQQARFQAEADWLGLPLENLVKVVLAKESERLFYSQRSRLKREDRPKPSRALKHLAKELREIYSSLRALYGIDYERLYREQDDALEAAIERGDMDALVRIQKEQPWVRGR